MARAIVHLLLAASCSLLTACSDRGDPVQPTPNPAGITFAADIQPIFNARCAISGCHVLPNPPAGLNLTAGASYANLVNVPTQNFVPGVRVTPNDLSVSVMYLLVSSGTMPASGRPLTSSQIAAIRTWIEGGAPNN